MSSEIIHSSTPVSLHPLSPASHPPAWPPLNKVNFLLVTCFLQFCRRKIQKPSIWVQHAQVFGQVASVCPITGQSLQLISVLNQIAVLRCTSDKTKQNSHELGSLQWSKTGIDQIVLSIDVPVMSLRILYILWLILQRVRLSYFNWTLVTLSRQLLICLLAFSHLGQTRVHYFYLWYVIVSEITGLKGAKHTKINFHLMRVVWTLSNIHKSFMHTKCDLNNSVAICVNQVPNERNGSVWWGT